MEVGGWEKNTSSPVACVFAMTVVDRFNRFYFIFFYLLFPNIVDVTI